MLCDWFEIIDIDSEMIVAALQNENWHDLEDGLQMHSAIQEKLDYIITRDINGFTHSEIKALLPEDFLRVQDGDRKG